MCDYCSCREQSLIGRLGGDHAQLLAWAIRIEAALVAADHDRARAGLEQLLVILDPHLDLEERALVPALSADDAFAVTVTRIADDHHRARVDRPAPDMSAPAWAAATRAYLADLRAHIHLEEYDVFPAGHGRRCPPPGHPPMPSSEDRIRAAIGRVLGRSAADSSRTVALGDH